MVDAPTSDEIEVYSPVLTPMDKKTIVNAITKRIPTVRKIDLVAIDEANYRYEMVIVCELLHEVAIIIEDDFNMMMRHKDLMNLVDRLAEEVKARNRRQKTNKLPKNFFREDTGESIRKYQ